MAHRPLHHTVTAMAPRSSAIRMLLGLVVLLTAHSKGFPACFLLPRGDSTSGSSSVAASAPIKGWGGGLGRMLAEAFEGGGGGGAPRPTHEQPACMAADELMRKRGPDNYRRALQQYKQLRRQDPENPVLKLKEAEASVSLLRALTNANAVMIDGISDSEANRKLWREHAFGAYDLLKELHKARPDDPHVHTLMAEAFTYRTSSRGIVKAAVTGDGLTFMGYVKQLVQRYPTYDEGVAYIYRGAFLLAAPWPLRDVPKAIEAFASAHAVQPRSLRNTYFLGVGHYHGEDYAKALKHFEAAANPGATESLAPSEADVAGFFRSEAKRALEVTRLKLKGGNGEL